MNEVYNNGTTVIHDDREFITPDQAFDLLWSGKSIMVCDPPNYGAENEYDIHSMPFPVFLADTVSLEVYEKLEKLSRDQIKKEVLEYLRSYELSR